MTPQRLAASLLALALVAGACDDGDGGTDGATTTTSSTTTTTFNEAAELCDFAGGLDTVREEPEGGPMLIDDVQHEIVLESCVEQVAFAFRQPEAGSELGYEVVYSEGPFRDVSGRTIEVEGEAFLEVALLNGTAVDLSGEEFEETFTGPVEVAGNAEFVVDVVSISDFEGVSEWVIGLDARHPFNVTYDPDVPSLTVDLGAA